MKKLFLVVLLGLVMVSFVSANAVVATEEQVVKMVSNIVKVCPSLTQDEIVSELQGYAMFVNPNVAMSLSATEICSGHFVRYSNSVFFLDGKDISTICTETEIINIQAQIGNLVHAEGDINDTNISQSNFNLKIPLSISLLGNIIEIGIITFLIRKKKNPKKQKTKKKYGQS
jgi:hypothetical protein